MKSLLETPERPSAQPPPGSACLSEQSCTSLRSLRGSGGSFQPPAALSPRAGFRCWLQVSLMGTCLPFLPALHARSGFGAWARPAPWPPQPCFPWNLSRSAHVSRAAPLARLHHTASLCRLHVTLCSRFVYFLLVSPQGCKLCRKRTCPGTFSTGPPAARSAPGTVIRSLKCEVAEADTLLWTEWIKSNTVFVEGRKEGIISFKRL